MKATLLPPATRTLAAGHCKRGAAIAAAVVLLAGCTGDSDEPGAASSAADESLGQVTVDAEGVQEITLQTQDDYVFTPDHFTVQPGEVRLTVINVADQMTHNFEFSDEGAPAPIESRIDLLAPGQSMTIDFSVVAPGDYPFECSFHIQLGQVGTMTVSGS